LSSRTLTIDPVTRLEGHGKITIFLDEEGNASRAMLQVPELRGFEKFAEGRPAEEMPRITSAICGICPTAHHMASGKALDALYGVDPPPAAKKIRELMTSAFFFEDHALHFFFLAGPDFLVGAEAPPAERNVLGVIARVGPDAARRVLEIRRRARKIIETMGGRAIHPVCNLPGGVSKRVTPEEQREFVETGRAAVEFAEYTLGLFHKAVLGNPETLALMRGDTLRLETYSMGLVDAADRVNFYDGRVRVVDPTGREFARFAPGEYLDHVAERVEPWTYVKFPYLKRVGWKGFADGPASGIYRVAPLARLNASAGMATPRAQAEHDRLFDAMGGKPCPYTLAYHWARLVEMLYAAERLLELAEDPGLLDPHVRNLPSRTPAEGIGVVEAPRGTLLHHYRTDGEGILREANLIVGTQNNAAAIHMDVERAAKAFIRRGKVSEGLLNRVEMAFRAYDPCFSCATHALPGAAPWRIEIRDHRGSLASTISRP
jgi:F420-non-reducing hydrogenase large subunit